MTKLTKPVKRTTTAREMPHGFRDDLVITLYPGAVVGVREYRRREELTFDLGALYARAVTRTALDRSRLARKGRP